MSIFARYKFTKKKHSPVGIMSVILGVISLISIVLTVYIPYHFKTVVSASLGMTLVLVMLLSIIGIVLSIICSGRGDNYSLFPTFGALFNVMALLACGYIIYLGLTGG